MPEIHGTSVLHACAHEGRVVVVLWNGEAFERAADGSWSRGTRASGGRRTDVSPAPSSSAKRGV